MSPIAYHRKMDTLCFAHPNLASVLFFYQWADHSIRCSATGPSARPGM